VPAQIIEQVVHALRVDRAAQHRVVGTAEPYARDLDDLLADRALLLIELFQAQLGKPGLLASGRRTRRIGGDPTERHGGHQASRSDQHLTHGFFSFGTILPSGAARPTARVVERFDLRAQIHVFFACAAQKTSRSLLSTISTVYGAIRLW
jgi:hypothetical protein